MTHSLRPAAEDSTRSLWIDLGYATITLASTTIWSILGGWLLYFYLPPEGEGQALVPAAWYGVTMFVTRVINAAIAPPVGYLSDHASSRWGRRLPFLFASALPLVGLFVLVWMPPVRSESVWNLVYVALVIGLYNVAYVFNQVPYMALLPEIAVSDHHRVRVSAWTSGFMLLGMIAGGLAGPLIGRVGYVRMAGIYGVVLLCLFYLPLLVLRERPGRRIDAGARMGLRRSISTMLHNRPFLILTASGLFYWGMTGLIQAIVPYIVTEICMLDTGDAMLFYVPPVLASLACYPLVTRLSDRFGKRRVFWLSLGASALVLPGLTLIGEWLPVPLLAQGLAWITLQAVAMSGVIVLQPALGAEVTDHDAALTGQRREGTYYATWGLLDQVINGVVLGALPLLLTLGRSRADPRGPLGVRLVGAIGGCMFLIAFLIFTRYPLGKQNSHEGGA